MCTSTNNECDSWHSWQPVCYVDTEIFIWLTHTHRGWIFLSVSPGSRLAQVAGLHIRYLYKPPLTSLQVPLPWWPPGSSCWWRWWWHCQISHDDIVKLWPALKSLICPSLKSEKCDTFFTVAIFSFFPGYENWWWWLWWFYLRSLLITFVFVILGLAALAMAEEVTLMMHQWWQKNKLVTFWDAHYQRS